MKPTLVRLTPENQKKLEDFRKGAFGFISLAAAANIMIAKGLIETNKKKGK